MNDGVQCIQPTGISNAQGIPINQQEKDRKLIRKVGEGYEQVTSQEEIPKGQIDV